MADFRIDSRMKVKTLKANFKKNFGGTLRVYTTTSCKANADDEATLGSLMSGSAKGGALTVGGNLRVGNFENKLSELYGIGVQVADKTDKKLANNNDTLVAAGK